MIKPTVGRVVWVFRPGTKDSSQPEAALIAYVWNDRLINVGGIDQNGIAFNLTSLPLVQEDEPKPEGSFATWMPFQKGQAAKTEQLEAEAGVAA
jgi:hypothetical protein